MPVETVERLQKRAERLAKKVAGHAEDKAKVTKRTLQKQLKRAQRKARRLTATAKRHAPKPEKSES